MKLWIARDKCGELWGYTDKPVLDEECGMYSGDFSLEHTKSYQLHNDWFAEVTFENSPQKVELKLVNEL